MTTALALILLTGPIAAQSKPQVGFTLTREEVKGNWSASARLPKISGSAVGKLAEDKIRAREMKIYTEFVKEARAFYRAPTYSSAGWSYESEIVAKTVTATLLSFVGSSYTFQGGAHGIGVKRTYNFGFVGGRPKQLTLDDVLAGPSARREVELRLLEKAMQAPGTDWIEGGEVRDFTREQLDRYWVAADGLSFEFDPYELGSYASGPFTFQLKWGDLKGLLNSKGPLSRFDR